MTYEIVSVLCGGPGFKAPGLDTLNYKMLDNTGNQYSPCEMYQKALVSTGSDIIIYAHDDLTIHEPDWLSRALEPFNNPQTVAVGLGGADKLANSILYKQPFYIQNMARSGYNSNQDDAEVHGGRVDGTRKVAVLDAFFMAVNTRFLEWCDGWPTEHLTHHCLDLWLACMAARCGYDTWMVGVPCFHAGRGTSIKKQYKDAKWLQGGTLDMDHYLPHKWIAHEFMDVLPLEVK